MTLALLVAFRMLAAISIEATDPLDLERSPSAVIGERVKLSSVRCVDEIHGGYLCIVKAGGSLIAIDAVILSDDTVRSDVDQYIEDNCKGTANLDSLACEFDATFTVASFRRETPDTSPLTRFFTTDIRLERSKP